MACVIWEIRDHRYSSEKKAIAAFKARGFYVDTETLGPPWLAKWCTQLGIRDAEALWLLRAQSAVDEDLWHLKSCRSLRMLDLRSAQVTDGGLAHLQKHTRMESLWLGDTAISDKGISYLRRMTRLSPD